MMQAYKQKDLYNKMVQQQASEAFEMQSIDVDTYRKILESHAADLYTPNFFIRVASGLLTVIAVIFSGLLLGLMANASGDEFIVPFVLFLCITCYIVLELLIKQKQYYNAGVDNVLMCCSIIFLVSSFFIEDYAGNDIAAATLATIFCLWLCIRFTDGFMAMLSFSALYVLVILFCSRAGVIGEAIAPFVLMFISAIVYAVAARLLKNENLLFYHFSCKAVRFLTLISFYISANYFIINEAGKAMFSSTTSMPQTLGILYWILTVLIPIVYVVYGIRKRDLLFIRIGFVLLIATILTIHYYHQFLPPEIDMLIGGLSLIAISYALMKYLSIPKRGFTFENTNRNKKELMNVEALIIAQLFGKSNNKQKGFEFGGGSSGGGGATGNY